MSRFDSVGMFWEDLPTKRGRNDVTRPMPPIPDTGWTPPREFPNLSAAKALGFDTETKDVDLVKRGPGWGRGKGHVIGLSIAVPNGPAWYFPIRHEVEPEYNMDPDMVLRWAGAQLKDSRPKIGANLLYDIGWMRHEGFEIGGPLYDIQFAEALLNSEAPDVSLEALAQNYLGLGKSSSLLYEWCADYYGGQANDRQRANMYRTPPRLAGPYAESDAQLPIRIMEKQWGALEKRGCVDLFHIECKLIRILMEMRMQGASVDVGKTERLYESLGNELVHIEKALMDTAGFALNPYSSTDIAKAFDNEGLEYGRSAKGNPVFDADFLEAVEHPIAQMIVDYRQRTKLRNTFIKGYILDSQIAGKVYCQFHALKSDKSGTRSGRFSSSTPNLQNIPVRSEMGRRLRDCFVAQKMRWRKFDYSQIEYRLLAHHAVGKGADEIRQRYQTNPDTDYHEATGALIKELAGLVLERRPVKTINFGLIYGMSEGELARRLGLRGPQSKSLFKSYHQAVPFARATMDAASDEARKTGTITTILGRKSDFPFFGPARWDPSAKALPFHEALLAYGHVERAFAHKALNRKLQGGAADFMKKAMVDAYEAGIFAVTGFPMLTVHDELDFDDYGDLDAPVWAEMTNIMQTCIPSIRVPIRLDMDIGKSWGDCG